MINMDEALEIHDYLPIEFNTSSEEEYLLFLWNAFENNYLSKNHQFAFVAYHLIMMSFIYFTLWKVKIVCSKDFNNALIGFGKEIEYQILKATSPFIFHIINERKIFRFLKIIGCTNDKIGKYAIQVDKRNKIAHANGLISFNSRENINNEIIKMIGIANEIQRYLNPIIEKIYTSFLEESANPNDREYVEDIDQVREILIKKHYLSKKDIESCMECDISNLCKIKAVNVSNTKALCKSFRNLYGDKEL